MSMFGRQEKWIYQAIMGILALFIVIAIISFGVGISQHNVASGIANPIVAIACGILLLFTYIEYNSHHGFNSSSAVSNIESWFEGGRRRRRR